MVKWLKVQPVVYRWINGAGWITTSYEVMKMKAINHKPMIRLEGTIAFKAVRMSERIHKRFGLTLVFGYLIIVAFADTIYHFMHIKYTHDVAKAFRNVFLLIGVGALITAIAGAVGGGLAGVSVGGFLGIVIGFATQQVMGQAVAGLFLLISRPFKITDHVNLVGEEGIVEDISILFTVIKKMDNTTTVLIPNNMILGNKIYVLPPVQQQAQQASK